ncbi:unnamed protein product [Thelazia callipaeda]|uniref:Transporter n=1 Tax=Thelazia callipaeda TaxID=103827 RepID=A0A0N5DBB9_THECL|nr:unnamed protein product [Thelazia callipaeda]
MKARVEPAGVANLTEGLKIDNKDKGLSVAKTAIVGRDQWSGRFDFIMSMIAYAVGLGNVWRFPYLCFKNGGGSFLVAYAIFFSFGALPIFILEITIGQYVQRGAMEMWKLCPLFKGSFEFMNDESCVTGYENTTTITQLIANLSKYNLTVETSVEQYWEKRVLMQTNSIGNFGGIQWELLGIMAFSWVIVYFALWKGITRARKVIKSLLVFGLSRFFRNF